MKRSFFSVIIIFLIGVGIAILFLSYIKNKQCSEALISLKSYIDQAIREIKEEDSNMVIKLKIPEEYSYIIYNKSGDIYVRLLSCNIDIPLNENVILVDKILSKRYIYLVKNNSQIYLSPYPLKMTPYKTYAYIGRVIQKSSKMSPKLPTPVPKKPKKILSKERKKIILYFAIQYPQFTSSLLISRSELITYSKDVPSTMADFFLRLYDYANKNGLRAKFLKQFLNENDYGIYVSEQELYGNMFNPLEVLNLVAHDCPKINKKYTGYDTIIAIFVWKNPFQSIGGYTFISPFENIYIAKELSKYRCNVKHFFYISVNKYFDEKTNHRVILHELMHDMGLLREQYQDDCRDTYEIYKDRGYMIPMRIIMKQYGNILCNYLNKNKDAKPFPSIVNEINKLYIDYPQLTKILGSKDYIIDDICTGNKTIFIKTPDNIEGFIVINNKDNDQKIMLDTECKVVLLAKTIEIYTCKEFVDKYNIISTYRINRGYCYANKDIVGMRDVMGNFNQGYLSEESIRALINNYIEVWGEN